MGLLVDFFKPTGVRKSFLVIWLLIMFFPSVFLVGMVVEGQEVRTFVERDGELKTGVPRVVEWGDLLGFFFWFAFGTVALYCVVGLEDSSVERVKRR